MKEVALWGGAPGDPCISGLGCGGGERAPKTEGCPERCVPTCGVVRGLAAPGAEPFSWVFPPQQEQEATGS